MEKQRTYEQLGLFHGDFSLPTRPAPGVGGGSLASRLGAPLPPRNSTTPSQPAAAVAAVSTASPGALLRSTSRGEHPAILFVGAVMLAVLGVAACTFGMSRWGRAEAAAAHHRVIHISPASS